MKMLTVGGGSFLTGSAIADAVLRYGLALAKRRDVDVVDIPYLAGIDDVRRAEFTIGWRHAVQAVTRSVAGDELVELGTTFSIDGKATAATIARAHPFTPEEADELTWPDLDDGLAI
jgi:hypothetical protein